MPAARQSPGSSRERSCFQEYSSVHERVTTEFQSGEPEDYLTDKNERALTMSMPGFPQPKENED